VQGLDVDIGTEIAKDLGYEAKWIKSPFERLFDLLANGEVELIISAISITPDRKKDFAFSEPYFETANTIARRKDNEAIRDLKSLSGKKVGVQLSSTGHRFMESRGASMNVTIAKFSTLDDALGALNRTEVDAVVGDEHILAYSINKSYANLATLGVRLTEEQYAVVVRKSEKELLASVNATIGRLKKSGELEVLRKKWFQDVMEQVTKERDDMRRKEVMKEGPKTVTFNFVKTSGNFRMERLDGYELNLTGANGRFKSSPILTNGSRGSCKFSTPVPPGEYSLSMPIFKLNTTIKIPKIAASSVTFDMKIAANGIDISQR
jgi:ABC-type amino acid transport substrate-binding protein